MVTAIIFIAAFLNSHYMDADPASNEHLPKTFYPDSPKLLPFISFSPGYFFVNDRLTNIFPPGSGSMVKRQK